MMPVFLGLTASLLALALVIAQTIVTQRDARQRAMAEGDTLLALQSVMRVMLEAESSQRGYVLTGKGEYLPPYLAAQQRLQPTLKALRDAAARSSDGDTTGQTDWIAGITDAKFAEMDRTVLLTRTGQRSQAMLIIDSDIGREQMEAIRAAIAGESARKAQLRSAAFARAQGLEKRLIPLIAVLGAAILALVYAGFRAERSRALAEADAAQSDALREANDRAELLARELNHRVKNLFSVILSIVTLSGRRPGVNTEVVETIRARIHALALAHATSQSATGSGNVPLAPVIAKTMEPYADDEGRRVRIGGPDVELPTRMITPIGMIIHELATNAVKYGALSAEGGAVEIRWDVRQDGATDTITLEWIETGGPALMFEGAPPARKGFGSQMTTLAAGQLGGAIEQHWPPTGAVIRLIFPVPASAS